MAPVVQVTGGRPMAGREGVVTFDLVVRAAFLRGQGKTHDEVCKALGIRNKGVLVTMLTGAGVPDVARPGMREIRCLVSNARYLDLKAMIAQAGYGFEDGLAEFLVVSAKDRTVRKTLARARG